MHIKLSDGEAEDSGAFKFFAGVEGALRELGHIGGIGIILGFEAEAAILSEHFAALAGSCAVEEIGAVELNAGKVGKHLHHPAADGVVSNRGGSVALIEAEIVIVAPALFKLVVIGVYISADGLGLPEIKGSSLNLSDFAGGDRP